MNVIRIVKAGLIATGYEGLVVGGVCGCRIGELSPANCLTEQCEAAYCHLHSKSGEWVMHPSKEKLSDERIDEIIMECT
ncbi:MAG: hypothetical protein CTY14_02215 [Methylotenera sp.]|nr:MAG: hypothetical protein CTY14_02215 [Methylotenera sp.]